MQGVACGRASRSTQISAHVAPATSQAAGDRLRELGMRTVISRYFSFSSLLAIATFTVAQGDYKVISVTDGGTVSGTIKWSGPVPKELNFPVTKDPQICAPDGSKTVTLERLIVGPEGGVANTVVYLKNISTGKALKLPEQRRHLDQNRCRYIPHILTSLQIPPHQLQ